MARSKPEMSNKPAVENRKGRSARRLELDFSGERLPGLVDEAGAFVEKPPAVAIDDDAVGVDQHHGRGIFAARIDRLGVHAVPVAGGERALRDADADAVARVEMRARRDQRHRFAARPEMGAHHLAVGRKAAAGENDRIGGDGFRTVRRTAHHGDAGDAAARGVDDIACRTAIADRHAEPLRRRGQRGNEGAPAADRLNPQGTGGEVIGRLREGDAVALEPGRPSPPRRARAPGNTPHRDRRSPRASPPRSPGRRGPAHRAACRRGSTACCRRPPPRPPSPAA